MCPFCQGRACKHFMGWTEDGKTYSWLYDSGHHAIPENASIVHTNGPACVYQESGYNPRLLVQPK